VETWRENFKSLASDPEINAVQIFRKSRGDDGMRNPHPLTAQIWANQTVPMNWRRSASFRQYRRGRETTLLQDYLELELEKQERVVVGNDHFRSACAFWAVWPFETWLSAGRPLFGAVSLRDAGERAGRHH